ncbi:serine/threonine-protein kinase [Caballeronia humi]|uniref:Protein kinase n=1 Tax=Caballeronia humi TaxID=326474 RepID=A0A158G7T6_9BURK|nr:serine/threonine-protein kinase [Caballeronia humi]SAL28208.1 protein kinase [Caballeronia humi]
MTRIDESAGTFGERTLALAPGSRLAEFDLIRLIGEGGFGIVYLAYDTLLHRQVAIKEFMPATLACRSGRTDVLVRSNRHEEIFVEAKRKFLEEARLLAQFDHESIVRVLRVWEANGTAYMAMPYYEGMTLWDTIRAKGTPPDENWLRAMLRPLMEALGVLHRAQCYHRDVSPDNIMIASDPERPVLLDLGAARRIIGTMSHAPTVIYKTGYAPVEQYGLERSMTQGPWTDVYALAAVVYFAITGTAPPASISRTMEDMYEPLAVVASGRYSARFLQAIDHALAVRPEHRPQSIAEFAAELGTHIDAGNGHPTPPPVEPEPASRPDRQRLYIAAAVLGVVALGGGAGWHLLKPPLQKPPPPPPPPPPYTPAGEMARIVQLADASQHVTVQSASSARIGRDKLTFAVTTSRSGFVYVFMTDPTDQYTMLFPNERDENNRVSAGETLFLPRSNWPMVASAPVGPNRFLVIVSASPRDFSDAGLSRQAPFAKISPVVQRETAARRTERYSPFAGTPHCAPGADCPNSFGAAMFQIDSVAYHE